jgi:DNA repair protein RadC
LDIESAGSQGEVASRALRIREMPQSERPRERLIRLGPTALSVVELLALIVGSGSLGRSSLEMAHEVVARCGGSLRRLGSAPLGSIRDIPGMGPAKAALIHAALELGRRLALETRGTGVPIVGPLDVYRIFGPRLEDLPVEEFHVAVLDTQHRLERDVTVTRGLLGASLVHPREVFREAIAERAASIILVHNHPSGDPTPSSDDQRVTSQLIAAGRLLDIPVHDHVIIGRGRYASFAESGLLHTGNG